MKKITLLASLLLISACRGLLGQSFVEISAQQCVWRAGDNAAWAAPGLDESGWHPYTHGEWQPDQLHIWVRCHADLSSLRGLAHPAIQVSLAAAYQVFLNGKTVGGAGNLHSGHFSMNTIRSFPLPKPPPQAALIALRVTRWAPEAPAALELRVGDESALRARRAGIIVVQSSDDLTATVCFGMIGVFGSVLLGLFLYDRGRRELLLLSIVCFSLAAIYLGFACNAALVDGSETAYLAVFSIAEVAVNAARPWFFFTLARRRVPLFFWVLIGLAIADRATLGVAVFLPAPQALWLAALRVHWSMAASPAAQIAVSVAPFVAFWPYSHIAGRMRPLAGLCMAWGATMVLFFTLRMTAIEIPGVPNLYPKWGSTAAAAEAITTLCVVAALLGLLFREQRQVAEERALLAGEMQAAIEIQRLLVPTSLDIVPGLKIEAAYLPAKELGGDFYRCRILPGGAQRLLLGDVSGKGAAAALTAAMLLGAAEGHDGDSPSALLNHLNRALLNSQVGGFATCLCAEISRGGALALANAGHLSPYLNGEELPLPPGLPLGIAPDAGNSETTLRLAPGDTLTFLSDGVVEARNAQGELFGFDRTRSISTQSAEQIANAAQSFGQEDDISVLSVTRTATTMKAAIA